MSIITGAPSDVGSRRTVPLRDRLRLSPAVGGHASPHGHHLDLRSLPVKGPSLDAYKGGEAFAG